jgi:uncharacterized membrane protein
MTSTPPAPLSRDGRALAAIFAASGVVHLARPEVYTPLMPGWVPRHRDVILASGVAELVCAGGLLKPRSRRAAGWASLALLLGVYPGNLKMAADAAASDSTSFRIAAFGRLPLQVPMLVAAYRAARR